MLIICKVSHMQSLDFAYGHMCINAHTHTHCTHTHTVLFHMSPMIITINPVVMTGIELTTKRRN